MSLRFSGIAAAGFLVSIVAAAGCAAEVVGGPDDVDRDGVDEVSGESSDADPCWRDLGPNVPGECTIGDTRTCPEGVDTGPSGYCAQLCVNVDGVATWGITTNDYECPFYDTDYHVDGGAECTCNTPLVLSFDGLGVTFTALQGEAFDLTRQGVCHASDWPTARTPWLALDLDGNGAIDDGGELFGSATRLPGGGYAKNGFEALRALDADGDGVFDARDAAFAKVVVWRDENLDRRTDPTELVPLAATGVLAIDLRDREEPRCDARGNCEGERSGFTFLDASGVRRAGTVIDVYLPSR